MIGRLLSARSGETGNSYLEALLRLRPTLFQIAIASAFVNILMLTAPYS